MVKTFWIENGQLCYTEVQTGQKFFSFLNDKHQVICDYKLILIYFKIAWIRFDVLVLSPTWKKSPCRRGIEDIYEDAKVAFGKWEKPKWFWKERKAKRQKQSIEIHFHMWVWGHSIFIFIIFFSFFFISFLGSGLSNPLKPTDRRT